MFHLCCSIPLIVGLLLLPFSVHLCQREHLSLQYGPLHLVRRVLAWPSCQFESLAGRPRRCCDSELALESFYLAPFGQKTRFSEIVRLTPFDKFSAFSNNLPYPTLASLHRTVSSSSRCEARFTGLLTPWISWCFWLGVSSQLCIFLLVAFVLNSGLHHVLPVYWLG